MASSSPHAVVGHDHDDEDDDDDDFIELAEAVAAGLSRLTLHLLPDRQRRPGTELLRDAQRVAGKLTSGETAGRAVGAVLATSWESLAFLVGAVLAGTSLCSLPEPARGATPADYHRFVERIRRQHHLASVVVDPDSAARAALEAAAAISPRRRSVATCTFAELGGGPPIDGVRGGFELVQFTSGSTGEPKGIVLPQGKILANIRALIPSILDTGFVAVSWLPLSHDMGLVGLTLAPIVAAGRSLLGAGTLALMPPRHFARQPASWLDACSELGATLTCAPDFGYALVTALVGANAGLDLSRLRCAASGGEPVRPATLRAFEAAAAPCGLAPTAMSPCYGLAEATLAVAVAPLDRAWRSVTLDRTALDAGEVVDSTPRSSAAGRPSGEWPSEQVEVVAVGPPLPGFDVRIEPSSPARAGAAVEAPALGSIQVRGPSLLDRYTDGSTAVDDDGWFTTRDLGFVLDGEVHVAGRRDDVLLVAGRLVFAHDLEAAVAGPGVRPGSAMVVRAESGRPVLLFEPERAHDPSSDSLVALCSVLATRLVDRAGTAPEAVWACRPGSLPRTPSGKPRRRVAERWLRHGTLPLLSPP